MSLIAAVKRRFARKPIREPRTHDWTSRNYMCAFRNGGQRAGMVFWGDDGPVPRRDDYLILRNRDTTTRYQVVEINPPWAVGDVYSAELAFAPRRRS